MYNIGLHIKSLGPWECPAIANEWPVLSYLVIYIRSTCATFWHNNQHKTNPDFCKNNEIDVLVFTSCDLSRNSWMFRHYTSAYFIRRVIVILYTENNFILQRQWWTWDRFNDFSICYPMKDCNQQALPEYWSTVHSANLLPAIGIVHDSPWSIGLLAKVKVVTANRGRLGSKDVIKKMTSVASLRGAGTTGIVHRGGARHRKLFRHIPCPAAYLIGLRLTGSLYTQIVYRTYYLVIYANAAKISKNKDNKQHPIDIYEIKSVRNWRLPRLDLHVEQQITKFLNQLYNA